MTKKKSDEDGKTARGGGKRKKGDELIAQNLRLVYDEIAAEPLPDDLVQLLNQLDEKSEDR